MALVPLIAFLVALSPGEARANPGGSSAVEVVRAFCSAASDFDKKALYAGELRETYADKPTLGQSFPPGVRVSLRELLNTGKSAMVAVEAAREATDQTRDYYVYLEKGERWRVYAVRALWLSGVFYTALNDLEKRGSRRTAEEQRVYELSKMTLKSDRFLKSYLQQNIDRFNRLVELHVSGKHDAEKAAAAELKIEGNLESRGQDTAERVVSYTIGGMLDNEVGYLYVPKGATAPQMSPGKYILVEHIAGPWYLFKTT
jgi:hypothetical protein